MDILNGLKEKVNLGELKELSSFFGESEDAMHNALNLSFSSLLQGLVSLVEKSNGADKILSVIRDGGHSGDILDDLKGLFSNQDKTQLLVTIGNNINNHFFDGITGGISDKIADFSSVKKTSASSILSLAAPLLLGFIGKQVKVNRLTNSSLSNLLLEQKDDLLNQLPPGIIGMFDQSIKEVNPLKDKPVDSKKTKAAPFKARKNDSPSSKESGKALGILAWLLLAGLVVAAAYYTMRQRVNQVNSQENSEVITNPNDSSTLNSQDELFDGIQSGNKATESDTEIAPAKSPIEKDKTLAVIPQDTEVKKEETKKTTFGNEPVKPAPKKAANTSPSSSNESSTNIQSISSQLKNNSGWSLFAGNSFRRNNADFSSKTSLNDLVSYMNNNPSKNLSIAGQGVSRLQEDRAYALRDALYQNGISLSRIQIVSGPSNGSGNIPLK